jgi:hypothetical protein
MENILGFSKSEIKLILKQKKVEKKIFAEIDSAVEMYKKIGLFRELDEKFEIPGAEEMMMKQQQGEEGGDEGGGGFGGGGGGFDMGGGLDMGGGEDLGGGEEAGAEAGGEEAGGGEEMPLAERTINKIEKMQENYTNSLLNELLGSDEDSKPKDKIEDNALIKRNNSMKFESQKLINRIQNSLTDLGAGRGVIKENSIDNNPLINGSNQVEQDSEQLMGEIEKYLRNRNNNA